MPDLNFKAQVPVYDANVRVGDRRDAPSPVRNRGDLLREMDRHGVEKALIYHAQGERLSPVDGNRLLEDWLVGDGRLEPQWMMMPTDESIVQIKELHKEGRVQAVRLHNSRAMGLPFATWAYDEMLSWLSENQIPLFIPLPEADANELISTLKDFPDLVTVLLGAHYSHHLWVRPMLKTIRNTYLELSRYEPIGQFESLVDEFGGERLVYGSWFSRYAMGPILFYTHQCGWDNDVLSAVCSANLERILNGEGGAS